jgi:hypothetical protein
MSTENTQAELNAVKQEITKTKLKVASDVGGMVGCVLLAGSAASLIGLPVVVGSLAYVASHLFLCERLKHLSETSLK